MFFSFGPQSAWDLFFVGIVLIIWLICFLALYVTRLVSRHFNVPKIATVLYVIEIISAIVISGLILWPVINFHLHSA